MPLEPENQHHLLAAEGYFELGMFVDADAELDLIEPEVRHLPEVLDVRTRVYAGLQRWDLMQIVARRLAQFDPDEVQWTVSWAFATRRAESLDAAAAILLAAIERHPNTAIFHYNLACYDSQRGNLKDARERLFRAIALDAHFKILALEDEDLSPLWDSMGF